MRKGTGKRPGEAKPELPDQPEPGHSRSGPRMSWPCPPRPTRPLQALVPGAQSDLQGMPWGAVGPVQGPHQKGTLPPPTEASDLGTVNSCLTDLGLEEGCVLAPSSLALPRPLPEAASGSFEPRAQR